MSDRPPDKRKEGDCCTVAAIILTVLWLAVGLHIYGWTKPPPLWYWAVLIVLPVLWFAWSEAMEANGGNYPINLDVKLEEEGCLIIGFFWIIIAAVLWSIMPLWIAALAAIPTTITAAVLLILGFKLLVRLFMVIRR